MRNWDADFKKDLLEAKKYRQFLKTFFTSRAPGSMPRPLSFQEFSNRAGFSSKSYMSDIIAGRKKLTPSAFDKVVLGLSLSKPWAHHLKILACLEEPSFRTGKLATTDIPQQLQNSCSILAKSISRKNITEKSPLLNLLIENDVAEIFAALGNLNDGESLEGIAKKINAKPHDIKKALGSLIHFGFVELDAKTSRYKPLSSALDALGLRDLDIFRADVLRATEKMKRRFRKQSASEKSLFMVQTFSVKSSKLSEFKLQLAELIEDFATAAEAPEGDTVAEILIGFTNSADE